MAINATDSKWPLVIANINNAASPYTVLQTDELILIDPSAGAVIINLPAIDSYCPHGYYRRLQIKDSGGKAGVNNITITANGVEKIDGLASFLITSNYGAIMLIPTSSTTWVVI